VAPDTTSRDDAVTPGAPHDPVEALAAALAATPATRSVDPDELARFHADCALDPAVAEIDVDAEALLAGLDRTPLVEVLTLGELLLAMRRFDVAVQVAEHAYTMRPMDHRVQDTLFRARLYRREGRVSAAPGRELQGLHCPLLWNTAHVLSSGNVHLCCSVWLRTPVGNVFEEPVDAIWTSPAAEAMRDSARDGSYRYCGKMACPQIRWRAFDDESARTVVEDGTPDGPFWQPEAPALAESPTRLNLSYDKTCNLACPSCRSERFTAKGEELARIERVTDRIIPALARAERLEVTGSGDPFASKSFRRLLQAIDRERCPDLRITLMTNGLLLDRREWTRFAHLHGMIDAVNVSVDAAHPDTYRVVRRGGELDDLVPNLHFIGELLAEGAIATFRLCFVVQQRNFREMPDFVRLGAAVGARQVRFQMLHDWGAMPGDTLHAQRIHATGHPEHGAFLEVLRALPADGMPEILSDFDYLLEGDDARVAA